MRKFYGEPLPTGRNKGERVLSFQRVGNSTNQSDKYYQNWKEHERYFVRTLNRLGRNIKIETRNVYHLRK